MQPLLPFGGVVLQRRGVTQEIGGLALIVQFRGALARFGGIDEELCGLCGNGFVEGHGFRMAPFLCEFWWLGEDVMAGFTRDERLAPMHVIAALSRNPVRRLINRSMDPGSRPG